MAQIHLADELIVQSNHSRMYYNDCYLRIGGSKYLDCQYFYLHVEWNHKIKLNDIAGVIFISYLKHTFKS